MQAQPHGSEVARDHLPPPTKVRSSRSRSNFDRARGHYHRQAYELPQTASLLPHPDVLNSLQHSKGRSAYSSVGGCCRVPKVNGADNLWQPAQNETSSSACELNTGCVVEMQRRSFHEESDSGSKEHRRPKPLEYASSRRFAWSASFTNTMTLLGGLVLIVAPLWVLDRIPGKDARLGAITAFLVVFHLICVYLTRAERSQVLGCTAG